MLIYVDELVSVEEDAAEGGKVLGIYEIEGAGEFFGVGRALEGEGEGAADLGGGVGAGIALEAFGEVGGLLQHELVVHEGEGLQGGGGGESCGGEVRGVGAIEGGEEALRGGADDEAVDAATPELGFVGGDGRVDGSVGFLIVEVLVAGATGGGIEIAADGEDGVAEGFGVEAAGVHVGEEAVGAVWGDCGRRGDGEMGRRGESFGLEIGNWRFVIGGRRKGGGCGLEI